MLWAGSVAQYPFRSMATVALFTLMIGAVISGIGCLVLVRSLDAGRGLARLQSAWTANAGASPGTANSANLAP
jgi:hypothetical protein